MPHPNVCVRVFVCEGGVRRQLRFQIAPRKRLELEASSEAECIHTHTSRRPTEQP